MKNNLDLKDIFSKNLLNKSHTFLPIILNLMLYRNNRVDPNDDLINKNATQTKAYL